MKYFIGSLILVCLGLFWWGSSTSTDLATAKVTITERDATIKELKQVLADDVAIFNAMRVDATNQATEASVNCAKRAKDAAAGAAIAPRERVVFKTKMETLNVEKTCPNVIATDAFGLRDVQAATGSNN